MAEFKLNSESIKRLEEKLIEVSKVLNESGVDDNPKDIFENVVLGCLDEMM